MPRPKRQRYWPTSNNQQKPTFFYQVDCLPLPVIIMVTKEKETCTNVQ